MKKTFGIFAAAAIAVSATAAHAQVTVPLTWKGAVWNVNAVTANASIALPGGTTGNMVWTGTNASEGNTLELGSSGWHGVLPSGAGNSWSFTYSWIDNQRADGDWNGVEIFLQDLITTGNPRVNFGATTPFQLDGVNNLRWRLASDRSTQINNYGGDGGPELNGTSAQTGFTGFVKDNSASNIRAGGTVESTTGWVSSTNTQLPISAAGTYSGTKKARTDDTAHTITIGKTADGVIEYSLNGLVVSTFDLNFGGARAWDTIGGAGFANFRPSQISLITRGQGTEIHTWTDFAFTTTYSTQVPEPASLGLLGLGSMLLLARRRKA